MSGLLHYLSVLEPGAEASELIHGWLIPAVSRIIAANAIAGSPYRLVLEALLTALRQKDRDHSDSGEFAWTSSSSSPFLYCVDSGGWFPHLSQCREPLHVFEPVVPIAGKQQLFWESVPWH